jgi:hypothetical protein
MPKGTEGDRRVLKWTDLRPEGSHATVLYGLDALDDVYVWVVPSSKLPKTSATVTSPRDRVAHTSRGLYRWQVPFDQVLPAISRCYDRQERA